MSVKSDIIVNIDMYRIIIEVKNTQKASTESTNVANMKLRFVMERIQFCPKENDKILSKVMFIYSC